MARVTQEACAAWVGRDWADATHDGCLPATGPARRAFLRFAHRPEAIDAGGQTLRTRGNGHPGAVGLERQQGPSVAAVRTDDCLGLCPVHPLTVATDREAFPPSRATDDPTEPGAGAGCAPRLLVAFGAPRERCTSAEARQQYAGSAPVTERRGTQSWGHWRLQCPTCLRHTCVAWAVESTRHAFWAQVSSQQPRDQGKAHQAAVRA